MSEIKGQILGVVLVLAIFGAIGTVLVTSFTNSANSVTQKMNEVDSSDKLIEDSKKTSTTNPGSLINSDLFENELLTF